MTTVFQRELPKKKLLKNKIAKKYKKYRGAMPRDIFIYLIGGS